MGTNSYTLLAVRGYKGDIVKMSDLCRVPKEKWVEWAGSGKSGMREYEGVGRQDGGASVSSVTVEQASVRCVTTSGAATGSGNRGSKGPRLD